MKQNCCSSALLTRCLHPSQSCHGRCFNLSTTDVKTAHVKHLLWSDMWARREGAVNHVKCLQWFAIYSKRRPSVKSPSTVEVHHCFRFFFFFWSSFFYRKLVFQASTRLSCIVGNAGSSVLAAWPPPGMNKNMINDWSWCTAVLNC